MYLDRTGIGWTRPHQCHIYIIIMHVEFIHRGGAAQPTKALVPRSAGFALPDAKLEVDRGPAQAQASTLVEAKGAAARAKAKAAKQATPSPQPSALEPPRSAGDGCSTLTPAAQGAVAGGGRTSNGEA